MLVAPPLSEVTMKNVTRSCHMPPQNDTSLSTLQWTQIVFMHRGTDRQLETTLKAVGMEDHSLGLAWAVFQVRTQDFVTWSQQQGWWLVCIGLQHFPGTEPQCAPPVHPLCTLLPCQRKKVTALHPIPAFKCLSLDFPFADMNECRMSIKALES